MEDFIELKRAPLIEGFRFDLQLFAAEDEGRTELPSEKKLREAREKGQVAKTTELPQSLVVVFGVLAVFFFASWIFNTSAEVIKYYLSSFSKMHLTERSLYLDFIFTTWESAKVMMPVFAAGILAAVIGNTAQVGFQFSSHPLKMDLSKIKFDPATVLKKIFFSKQVGANLLKSVAKVLAIGITAGLIITGDFDKMMSTPDISLGTALNLILTGAMKIIIWASVILLVLAVPDYFFQKKEFIESMKMSKQEVKQELKESMGDPHIRARQRDLMRDLLTNSLITEVPKADVVVTNPTHFAVALLFDSRTMSAPTVTAKGQDSIALRIRQIAREHNVPMIENRPLAQQLYRTIEVGEMIPPELFHAVTVVYAELPKFRQAV